MTEEDLVTVLYVAIAIIPNFTPKSRKVVLFPWLLAMDHFGEILIIMGCTCEKRRRREANPNARNVSGKVLFHQKGNEERNGLLKQISRKTRSRSLFDLVYVETAVNNEAANPVELKRLM